MSFIRQAEASGTIHGVRICRRALSISHLLFADDSFLFFRAIEAEAQAMKNILHHDTRSHLTTMLGVVQSLGTGKYLGLPSMVGRNRKAKFQLYQGSDLA